MIKNTPAKLALLAMVLLSPVTMAKMVCEPCPNGVFHCYTDFMAGTEDPQYIWGSSLRLQAIGQNAARRAFCDGQGGNHDIFVEIVVPDPGINELDRQVVRCAV